MYRRLHVRRTELGDDRAVAKLNHRVHDRLGMNQHANAIHLEVAVYNSIAAEPCVQIEMSPFLYRRLQQALHSTCMSVAHVPVWPVTELAEIETAWAWRVA